jgi:glyoxalase superfamily protein
VVLDAADPGSLAEFWAQAAGYVVQPPPEGFDSWPAFLAQVGVPEDQWDTKSAAVDPAGAGPRLFFQKVPEPKTVKNRVHIDLQPGAGHPPDARPGVARAEAERLVGLGASVLREVQENGEFWIVLADPEGNEFCVS